MHPSKADMQVLENKLEDGEHFPAWYEVAFTYFYMDEVLSDMGKGDLVIMTSILMAFSGGDMGGIAGPISLPS